MDECCCFIYARVATGTVCPVGVTITEMVSQGWTTEVDFALAEMFTRKQV